MKVTSILMAVMLALLPACSLLNDLGPPITTIAVKEMVGKKPSDGPKVLRWMDGVDSLVALKLGKLELKDFVDAATKEKLGSEWAVLANTIYQKYKDKVILGPGKLDTVIVFMKSITRAVRDGVSLVPTPQK